MSSYTAARLLATPHATPLLPRSYASPRPLRTFTSSTALSKKAKGKKMAEQDAHNPGASSAASSSSAADHDEDDAKHPKPSPEDPLNFDDLTARWAAAEVHFRDALKTLSSGGRFNPDAIGALLVAPSPKSPERYPLHELAQVVPRTGRNISLLAHEKEHIKPIMAAIQASPDFNQQPQLNPDNELELTIKIEAEKKEDLIARAKSLTLAWRDRVRNATEKRKKLITKWFQQKEIGPDLRKKVEAEMLKKQKKALDTIDQLEKQTLQKF